MNRSELLQAIKDKTPLWFNTYECVVVPKDIWKSERRFYCSTYYSDGVTINMDDNWGCTEAMCDYFSLATESQKKQCNVPNI